MKRIVIAGLIAGFTTAGALAISHAGAKQNTEVRISGDTAYGSLGSARNSADTRQRIGCDVMHASATQGYCSARNAAGTWMTCATQDPAMVDVIKSIDSTSMVMFSVNGGTCSYVRVYKHSLYAPK